MERGVQQHDSLAIAVGPEQEPANEDGSAGTEGGGERAVWDALPLFTFGSCRLNKLGSREILLTFYAEDP